MGKELFQMWLGNRLEAVYSVMLPEWGKAKTTFAASQVETITTQYYYHHHQH